MVEKLIVMLTHHDVTVSNAKEVFESCRDLPVVNWGFKDVGMPPAQMRELCQLMKQAGKTTFLEVVTYSEEECKMCIRDRICSRPWIRELYAWAL